MTFDKLMSLVLGEDTDANVGFSQDISVPACTYAFHQDEMGMTLYHFNKEQIAAIVSKSALNDAQAVDDFWYLMNERYIVGRNNLL